MSAATIDKLIWVLLYGGLLVVSLGIFVRHSDETLGWVLIALGAMVSGAGALLVWVRSRMPAEAPLKKGAP